MTDRMTERFESTETTAVPAPGASGTGGFDLDDAAAPSETVTRSAAVDELTLGQDSDSSSTADVAKEHAGAVAQDAKESTKNVASTAASEAKDVAHEARTQARQLFDQLSGEATEQATGQTQRAVQGLRSLSSELSGMAQGQQGQSGMATDLAQQGAARISAAADWLDGRQPGEILDEVRSFARRRPGAFLAGAAVLGIIGGRMTRGLTGSTSGDDRTGPTASARPALRTADSSPVGTAHGNGAAGTAHGNGAAGTAYDSGAAGMAYDDGVVGTGMPAEPVDLEGTDPSRVDAGLDPATYTHPASSTGASGETR